MENEQKSSLKGMKGSCDKRGPGSWNAVFSSHFPTAPLAERIHMAAQLLVITVCHHSLAGKHCPDDYSVVHRLGSLCPYNSL
jgi:hypothetical protein